MEPFDPRVHFEFKGKPYHRGSGHLAVGVRLDKFGTEKAGSLKRIHVNRHHIAANKKDGGRRPVYTVKVMGQKTPVYARSVIIDGPSHCMADEDQLSCGARVWIETNAQLHYRDPMTFAEAKAAFADAVLEE
jgi:hypothetical protein